MSSLFRAPAPPPPPPVVMPSAPPPPPVMPDPMSPTAREAAMNDMAKNAGGQAGTNLTGNKKKTLGGGGTIAGGNAPGTDSFSGTKLGGA